MCDLEKVYANTIYISNNPIEKIKFRDKAQFLNVVSLNDFTNSKLPNRIKLGLKECADEIDTARNLSKKGVYRLLPKAELLYNMKDEDVKRYFTYAESCEKAYHDVQNSGMCA